MELVGYFLAALVGLSLGLIGGGGSILTVPILVYIMGVNPVLATSYSLFIVGSTSLVGAVNNYRKGFVSLKTALLFGLSSVTTVFLTRKLIMPRIPAVIYHSEKYTLLQSTATLLLFALLMILAAIAMIRNNRAEVAIPTSKSLPAEQLAKLIFYGVGIGLVTGFLGAGGGFLLIPALVLIVKLPMKTAVGTSLLIIAINSLIGFTGDLGHFAINWRFLLTITGIAVTGILIGGVLAKRMHGHQLKKAFGWFVLAMGIYILVKEFFFTTHHLG